MSVFIRPSKPFSNGMSYEFFMESFCERCKHGKVNKEGFAELPENGGCETWDSLENARYDLSLYPSNDVVEIEKDNGIEYAHICKHFENDDADIMERYRKLFEEEE